VAQRITGPTVATVGTPATWSQITHWDTTGYKFGWMRDGQALTGSNGADVGTAFGLAGTRQITGIAWRTDQTADTVSYAVGVGPAVSISGPGTISSTGSYTWTAVPTGCASTCTYQWAYMSSGSSTWINLGTGVTQTRSISSSTPNFTLRVTATSAGYSTARTKFVSNATYSPPGGGRNPFC